MADSTVADLDGLFAASAQVRRRFEWQVYLNLAFYAGYQWMAWDGNMLYEPSVEEWREKTVDNRIQPFVRTEIAKLTKTKPQWVGVPDSQSDDDVAAARYAEMALEDAWRRHDLLRKLRAALLWSRCAGAGFWKVWWDSSLGASRDVLAYSTDHPNESLRNTAVKDTYGRPVPADTPLPEGLQSLVTPRTVSEGDLCVELRTYFEMFPDPLCGEEGLSAAEWIGEESVYSRGYVERRFPDFADRLNYSELPSSGISESRMPAFSPTASGDPSSKVKGAKLREYWSKDKHAVWSGKTMLLEEANPYSDPNGRSSWNPYVMFRGVPVPGRFWPDCVVTHLRPRQVDLNKRLSQIGENAERIGNPPLLYPSSMGDDFQWHGLPGEAVMYSDTGSPNAMPRFMEVPELPEYVREDVNRIQQSLMEISGSHEVSSAQVPAGVTAASAINLLQEQDDTRLGPDVADMEQALSQAGDLILDLVETYYSDERHLQVASDDGRWDVEAFKGAKLAGCNRIEVQTGSAMPQSKAARQAALQQFAALFAQNGQMLGSREWRKLIDEMGMGSLGSFFAAEDRDDRQVQEENRQMSLMAGGEFPINSYDNDQAHIAGHQDFQKTAKYAQLDDQAKQVIEGHVAAHRDRVTTAAMANQPPPPGPPGVPPGQQQLSLPSPVSSTPAGLSAPTNGAAPVASR